MNQRTPVPMSVTVERFQTHVVRNCIICDRDDAETLFTYTYDFLAGARGISPEHLRELGWGRDTTSSIVRCRCCGCNYVRNIFVVYEHRAQNRLSEAELEEKRAQHARPMTFANRQYLRYCRALADAILRQVARHKGSAERVSLLDFGSSLSSFSLTARASGFSPVVLYDPYLPENIAETVSNQHPIDVRFVRTLEELRMSAPFDAITCQAAVEHFYDPNLELRRMHDLLADGGILFITNPVEPLDDHAEDLARERMLRDPKRIRFLKKNYHIQHVNFPSPKQFSSMLRRVGFEELSVPLLCPSLDESAVSIANGVRAAKTGVLYALDVLGVPHRRKTNYFCVKRRG